MQWSHKTRRSACYLKKAMCDANITDPRLLSERDGGLSCSGACSSLSRGFFVSSLHRTRVL